MTIARKQESLILLLGDILFFLAALWLTLTIRYAAIPNTTLFYNHFIPFSFLFVAWISVYFISGLYDKQTTLLRSRLLSIILKAQIVNIGIASVFFFFIPYFGITPKTNLIIYLATSSVLIVLWRMYLFPRIESKRKQKAILIGYRSEVEELVAEVNRNPRYNIEFALVAYIDEAFDAEVLQQEVLSVATTSGVSVVVADIKSRKTGVLLPALYNLAFLEVSVAFLDIHKVYESVFDRIPLSALNESWILENISSTTKSFYDVVKRMMDIGIALLLGVVSLPVYPFVFVAIKLEDGGPVFIRQNRIGINNKVFAAYKFRSMNRNEDGVWVGETDNKVTTVGSVIRKLRIDELPQLWSILKGDLSFVGPRPDVSGLYTRLSEEIPHYAVRNVIKPGLTGWAQIKQEYGVKQQVSPQSIMDTKIRLAYDVYYVKNRSILLDIRIALRTIQTVLSKLGS
jgi:exopolysaccharide biosynthesis polyprenyl glycosylphosphotransferase